MNERIVLNKDEKKKKRKFLQKIQVLYIIPNNFRKHRKIPEEDIVEIKFRSVRSITLIRRNKINNSGSKNSRWKFEF
jgi:hypothetical protein